MATSSLGPEDNVDAINTIDYAEQELGIEQIQAEIAKLPPRFLAAPDEVLLPRTHSTASEVHRESSTTIQPIKKPSAGMLPSSLAHIVRRHPSAHRPLFQSQTQTSLGGNSTDRNSLEEEQYRFGGPMTPKDFTNETKNCCTIGTFKRKLPILQWLPKYSREDFVGDLIAGLTVGLTVVPQCLAYAVIADIDLEYGLNSAYLGCFVYTLLGTSKDVTVGPTAILSLLTGTFISRIVGTPGEWAVLLCFFVGCFQLAVALLRLGFIINFISVPVVSGFTQAAVIVIILSQVKNMMGLKFGEASDTVIETIGGYIKHMSKTNGWDVLLGCISITTLLLMKGMRLPLREGSIPKWYRSLADVIHLCGVSRYAIVVMSATLLNYLVMSSGIRALSATGNVTAKLSAPKMPNFAVGGLALSEILRTFGPGLVLVPLLAMVESLAVAKTFAHKYHYNISITQEFLALGTANMVSSFFGSYAVTGAFTRSALNAESGVRTPMGGIVTGSFVIIAIVTLSSALQYIPKAALAAVIICACLNMLDFIKPAILMHQFIIRTRSTYARCG
ncbi:sodium-independent sulfate anion transporter-like [Paramacrobiotus metropolitanus]|uniref:sodium-independent sulfate anion transporter-like n=1 Tax=Paramacrobiotus metropolitanus TaxID=2943436 RepID=UPI0024464B00|nr:sodium-independent sulfate anion transporter-like [Paramacrobiotus metropolitanus]